MSQRELAERLQVRPSFLSAIENGRSRMPEEKMERLKEIFEIDDFGPYMIEEEATVPPHTHPMGESDTLTQLLQHFHMEAHRMTDEGTGRERLAALEERNDFLERRNDRLSERLDMLREQLDTLREENYALKALLLKNGISL